jgi:hypothetical protein
MMVVIEMIVKRSVLMAIVVKMVTFAVLKMAMGKETMSTVKVTVTLLLIMI